MADFRKWIPVLAVLVLLAGTASAQVGPALACTSNAGVPPIVRAEGLTELVGDVVLNCTGGVAGSAFTVNWQIFLNTNVTSRLIQTASFGNLTEALLMIDELTTTGGIPCLPGDVSAPCTSANANTFRGTLAQANSVVWVGVPFVAPGSGTRIIRITNVRANANQIGASSTLVPSQIVMYISASGSQSVPINNPQQTVAFVQTGMTLDVRNCANSGSPGSATQFSQCANVNRNQFRDSTTSADLGSNKTPGVEANLRYRENFANAFKVQAAAGDQNTYNSRPGVSYNSESGFTHTRLGTETGAATAATRLIARFSNIPAGVKIEVGTENTKQSGFFSDDTAGSLAAVLIASDANGITGSAGLNSLPVAITPSSTSNHCSNSAVSSINLPAAEIPISATGTATAVWEVISASPSITEAALFPVIISYEAFTNNNLPGLGTATVAGGFAPVVTGSSAGTAQGFPPAPVPRFVDVTSGSKTLFAISSCVSNLLFPFITNQSGFETGLVIGNTTQDPFGTTAQAGTCVLNFYGTTTGGGAAPAAITTQSIPSGQQLVMNLGSGGNFGVGTTAAGFQGYMIAQCNFRYAHGFAFISDLGAQKLAMGYLALVMDAATGSRATDAKGNSTSSEALNN